jgi:hypothetical protein
MSSASNEFIWKDYAALGMPPLTSNKQNTHNNRSSLWSLRSALVQYVYGYSFIFRLANLYLKDPKRFLDALEYTWSLASVITQCYMYKVSSSTLPDYVVSRF